MLTMNNRRVCVVKELHTTGNIATDWEHDIIFQNHTIVVQNRIERTEFHVLCMITEGARVSKTLQYTPKTAYYSRTHP